ncbi:WD repeat-containing protein on Y chromosome-like [Anoplopoma fimbria]|uniref:WD repeat-containing protein on Y chromosome-like n=1 Tax=Anoplopoma fimbria TaxID=229290 RepID=UPI0023EB0856|nr:WD repeat-containing protein on Y chromosome-like [Anoplopoma fimbria]
MILELYRKADADGGGGLDIDEFCEGLKEIFGTDNDEELTALFYKIDINCDGTVDLGELIEYLVCRNEASKCVDQKNNVFPKAIKVKPVNHFKEIVQVIFRPFEDDKKLERESDVHKGQIRTYQRGQYISISSDGILTLWSDRFDESCQKALNPKKMAHPFSHEKKMHINGMVYIKELKQVAVSTSEREVLFYRCNEFPKLFSISHGLIVEDNTVSAMNYWSNGTKAVLSIGDVAGFLYVLISNNIPENGLFSSDAYEEVSLRDYPTLYVSTLLKKTSKDFRCVKIPIFNDYCTKIQYFPSIESLAICGSSSQTMVMVTLPKTHGAKFPKKVFESTGNKDFFTCVEFSVLTGHLMTGGTDGLLREWYLHKTMSCKQSFAGHVRSITHINLNPKDQVYVTLSEDKNVRVWSEEQMLPLQSFYIQGMEHGPISSMCYNKYNNELVLANSQIGTYLGRGTDVFQEALTSHDKPLCCALYHSIYKQVISVCQNGVVTVWDVLTGKAAMQFKLTPDQHVGHTAIAFDEPQRRLITVSQDGKLRLWNFNNGNMLAVLPVTLPKEVTGIVCLNNRVFVSGRNSKIIYDLDMEGYDNRFWEHDYLNDVSSMDVHENTLITASANGNVVIWDCETAEVLCCINGRKSPRTLMAGRRQKCLTKSLSVEKNPKTGLTRNLPDEKNPKKSRTRNKTAVKAHPLIKCLQKRDVKADTATLLTSADGYICAWSVNIKGGLLGKFRAVDEEGAFITTMSTDVKEHMLLTGDSTGKICQWDIQQFGFMKQANKGPFEVTNGWRVSLAQLPLLGSWQCHRTEVVSVQCDPSCKKIITAGLDCNLHLWENTGSHIGLFGKDKWGATQLSLEEKADQEEIEGEPVPMVTRYYQKPVMELLHALGPTSPIPNLDKLFNQIEKLANPSPKLTEKQLMARCTQAMKIKAGFDLRKDLGHLRFLYSEAYKHAEPLATMLAKYAKPKSRSSRRSRQPSSKEVHQGSETTSTSSSPNTSRTLDCSNATNSSTDMQHSANTVKQGAAHHSKQVSLTPISEKVQLTHSRTQLKSKPPPTPFIRGGTDPKQSSPQALNQIRSKYGRVLKNQQGHTLKDSVLTPSPPNTLSGKQESQRTSEDVHFPPIPARVQLTHNQTQLKPKPPQNPLIRGGTDPKQSSPQALNQTRSKYGRVHKIQQGDTLKDSVLTPSPLNTLPGKQESKRTSEDVHFPPIPDRVQLTHNQTQLKPKPPQNPLIRGGTDPKQRSPQALHQTRSKYGRVHKIQQGDTLKDSVITPCPPITLPAIKTSPHMQLPASTVKPRSVHTSKHVRLPPISEKAQLTTGCNATKGSPRISSGRHHKTRSPNHLQQAPPFPNTGSVHV